MKKICLIAVLLVLINNNIFSQKMDQKLTFQSSPLLYLADLIYLGLFENSEYYKDSFFIMDLEAQYKINNLFNVSLTTAFFIWNSKSSRSNSGDREFQMIFKPMFIYRPLKTGLKGFYLGLNLPVGWNSAKGWYNNEYGNRNAKELGALIGLGFNIGYKWIFNNGFTLQLGTGVGKTWVIPRDRYFDIGELLRTDGNLRLPNLDIHILDLKLGYSF